jgi:hypothetical protein
MMTREELIDNVVELYIQGSDSDGQWDSAILESVMAFIVAEDAGARLAKCDHCGTTYAPSKWDYCPYWDNHPCAGGCGNTNDDCTCDNCSQCGCYDCECPRCTRCGEIPGECPCPEEEVVFA